MNPIANHRRICQPKKCIRRSFALGRRRTKRGNESFFPLRRLTNVCVSNTQNKRRGQTSVKSRRYTTFFSIHEYVMRRVSTSKRTRSMPHRRPTDARGATAYSRGRGEIRSTRRGRSRLEVRTPTEIIVWTQPRIGVRTNFPRGGGMTF